MKKANNTPVIIGLGFEMNRAENPHDCPEPYQLMVNAARNAALDCGHSKVLEQLESIAVQQGMWDYTNPGALVAEQLGCRNVKSQLSDLGVLQLTPFFELCNRISAGEQQLGLVTGGEAKFRELRSKITGVDVSNTRQENTSPAPDEHFVSHDPFASDVEMNAQIFMPVELFAVIESALRHSQGLGIEAHRDKLAELYAEFSQVASRNPHAWHQQPLPPAAIRNAEGKNAMLAFPYTKKHNTQWNVNQAVAIMVSSVAKARELGVDESNWVFPLSAARSNHVVTLAQQRQLHSHPGTIAIGERAFTLAGKTPADLDLAELYSCFPAAVQSFAQDLHIPAECPLSVTGSMAFAGGPYNHAALDGVARMAEVLRTRQSNTLGLVSNLSGIFGKTGVMLLSNESSDVPYQFADVTDEIANIDTPLITNSLYCGPAEIVGYTVSFSGGVPQRALAYCALPDEQRTVVQCTRNDLMQDMMVNEYVGRRVQISANQSFEIVV